MSLMTNASGCITVSEIDFPYFEVEPSLGRYTRSGRGEQENEAGKHKKERKRHSSSRSATMEAECVGN